jgi:hypothetical protein
MGDARLTAKNKVARLKADWLLGTARTRASRIFAQSRPPAQNIAIDTITQDHIRLPGTTRRTKITQHTHYQHYGLLRCKRARRRHERQHRRPRSLTRASIERNPLIKHIQTPTPRQSETLRARHICDRLGPLLIPSPQRPERQRSPGGSRNHARTVAGTGSLAWLRG